MQALQEHFEQLHARENAKRLRAGPKRATKYFHSHKAQRFRRGAWLRYPAGLGFERRLRGATASSGGARAVAPWNQTHHGCLRARREAAADVGLSRRVGQRGRTLKVLVQRCGVRLREVSGRSQAADERLVHDARNLLRQDGGTVGDGLQPALVLVSDDSGFAALLEEARMEGWGVLVVSARQEYGGLPAGRLPWRHVCEDPLPAPPPRWRD